MTKKRANPVVMLNSFQHLVRFSFAFGRHTFPPRPQDGVFRCDLNKSISKIMASVFGFQIFLRLRKWFKDSYLEGKTFPLWGGTQSGKKRKLLPLLDGLQIVENKNLI